MNIDDVSVHDERTNSWRISLSKLTGMKVTDVLGYFDSAFGDVVFHITRITLDGWQEVEVDGEHDIAYMNEIPNVDDETMADLYRQQEEQDR